MMQLILIGLVCAAMRSNAQQDGNPHHWDRTRRCDQIDYDPPCGPCEGIGGIVWGDDNKDYTPTSCEVIANASSITDPKRPVWGATQTIHNYYEILIGKKTDPFCFQAFPGNDSVGELCYRPQQGKQTYDAENRKGLRYDVNIKTELGNVSSIVLHQGKNMWIVNHFPWYEGGIHQCICTEPHQGGDYSTPPVYPIAYNWTDNLRYVGREKLGVEYISIETTLDHWAFGPHHVWSYPDSGQVLRMWQPFNGLEVFPDGTNPGPVDESAFADVPPTLCKKKGGALVRIKCDDDGYPVPPKNKSASKTVSVDHIRARQKVPGASFRGESFGHMSSVLNKWLERDDRIGTRACEEWSSREIQQLQGLLYLLRDDALDKVYQAANDNRRMRATLEQLQSDWKELNSIVDANAHLHTVQRDGHCHEAVMWYVHHLTEEAKDLIATMNLKLPLLAAEPSVACETLDDESPEALHRVCKSYTEQVTCASCHSNWNP